MSFEYDKQDYIESDVEKIQTKTGMYISYLGQKGAGHLAHEMINNGVDELENPKSPGKKIEIVYDIPTDQMSIEDDGRGILENDKVNLEILCTKLNSGSKFTREQGGKSAGENGVGMTAVNALSDEFVLSTCVEGSEHTIKFKQGKKMEDKTSKSKKTHGTKVSFIPSKKFLGKGTSIPYKEVLEWVESLTYFMRSKIKIDFVITNGLETVKEVKMKAKTIDKLFNKFVEKPISPVFTFYDSCKGKEEWRDRIIDRELDLSFVFAYSNDLEPYNDSYCNFVNTVDGGVHYDIVQDCIIKYLSKATQANMTDSEKEKMNILTVDITSGLNLLVNLSTDMQIQFVGQTKEKLSNKALIPYITTMTNKSLDKYFSENADKLKGLAKIIKLNAKARLEAQKIKDSSVSVSRIDIFKDILCNNFLAANNRGKKYREIIAIEGKSAKGSGTNGRDPNTQAFFAFRGFTANGISNSLDELVGKDGNVEWRQFVEKLGCNIGPKFDLSKLNYDKIIILTDADIDGAGITSGICSFFHRWLRPVVEAGMLYKAVTPLYKTNDKEHEFVVSKQDFISIFEKKLLKKFKIAPVYMERNDIQYLSKEEFSNFLYATADYEWLLGKFAKHFKNKDLVIEKIAIYLHKLTAEFDNPIDKLLNDDEIRREFTIYLQEDYPELYLRGNKIMGIIDGRHKTMLINDDIYQKSQELFDIYDNYGGLLLVTEKNNEEVGMTILELFKYVAKYIPKILHRYKGVGEANGDVLWDTTLNPDTRTLIQLTSEDVRKEAAVFDKLYGDKKEDKLNRKLMMKNFKLRRDEIDN